MFKTLISPFPNYFPSDHTTFTYSHSRVTVPVSDTFRMLQNSAISPITAEFYHVERQHIISFILSTTYALKCRV